jgi:hypothetical protein
LLLGLVDGVDLEDRVIPLSTLLAATNPRLSGTAFAASREYWLARCEGFRVLSDDGAIGVIERVGYRTSAAPAAFLLVRGGMFGTSAVLIDADDALDVDARRQTVRLRRGYRETAVSIGPGALSRLLRRLMPPSLPRRAHS